MSIEVVQTYLFPLVLILFWKAPLPAQYRVPVPALLAALGCWTFASLNIRGYLPEVLPGDRIVLTQLEGDDGEKSARELLRRYNVIANAYSLPKMDIVMRKFSSGAAARAWLTGRDDIHLLVSGTAEWLNISFPANKLELAGSIAEPRDFPPSLVEAARSWKVPLDESIRVVRIPELSAAVVLPLLPPSLALPGEPSELSRHYLGWLAEGLGRAGDQPLAFGNAALPLGGSPEFSKVRLKAWREDALAQTCLMLGSWKSPEPIALARLVSGTYQLADALAEDSANYDSLYAAFSTLNAAQKTLRREQHPELLSLIRNNTIIARLFFSGSEEEFAKIRHELLYTAAFTDNENRPTLGARIAMLNLMLLEEAGLL